MGGSIFVGSVSTPLQAMHYWRSFFPSEMNFHHISFSMLSGFELIG